MSKIYLEDGYIPLKSNTVGDFIPHHMFSDKQDPLESFNFEAKDLFKSLEMDIDIWAWFRKFEITPSEEKRTFILQLNSLLDSLDKISKNPSLVEFVESYCEDRPEPKKAFEVNISGISMLISSVLLEAQNEEK